MDEQIEEEISQDDSTPSVLEQAHSQGWNAGYYHFGKAEGNFDYFNPSIVERDDGIWLIVRRSEPHPLGFRFGQNFIWAFLMDEEGKVPKKGIRLRWKEEITDQHFEDPRGFYHPDLHQTLIGACTFVWYPEGRWTGAHQVIGSFDDDWICAKMDYPRIGGASGQLNIISDKKKYEKNWLPFLHDNHLHILYKADPWVLTSFGTTWSDVKEYRGEGVKWAYGDVRGGTSPVKVGDYYFTFPHSSLPWRGRYRRYYAGAMAFDAKPPFTPRMITPEPILRGSQNDPWAQKKPLVIFPCGALYRNGTWLITCGVNDLKAAWVEIPHEDILKLMVPIRESGGSVFPASGLSDAEIKKRILPAAPVLAESSHRLSTSDITAKTTEGGEARESTESVMPLSPTGTDSRGGGQNLSAAEILKQKRQANAAKARAARAAKRAARVIGFYGDQHAQVEMPDGSWQHRKTTKYEKHNLRRRIKRRKRRTKAQMAAARLQALKEYEAKKVLHP